MESTSAPESKRRVEDHPKLQRRVAARPGIHKTKRDLAILKTVRDYSLIHENALWRLYFQKDNYLRNVRHVLLRLVKTGYLRANSYPPDSPITRHL